MLLVHSNLGSCNRLMGPAVQGVDDVKQVRYLRSSKEG